MFGMKGSGRFGEVEEKLPKRVSFKLQIVVFLSFTLFKKHFRKDQTAQKSFYPPWK